MNSKFYRPLESWRDYVVFLEEKRILDTFHRYSHAIDYGDESEWVDCFTADGVFEIVSDVGPAPLRVIGETALRAYIADRPHPPARYQKHLLSSPRIAVGGKRATALSYFVGLALDSGVPYLRSFGLYRDTLRKCPDRVWRIEIRTFECEAFVNGSPGPAQQA